jgi:putative Holliday junction resolvase
MIALGIDHGDARIGVAASDALGMLAHPVETVPAQPPDAALRRLTEIFRDRRAERIVMGLPIREDGTEGTAAEKIRRFAAKLAALLPAGTPMEFQDEYGSTKSAAEALSSAGRRMHRHRPVIDQAAAVVILQDWLDAAAAKARGPVLEPLEEDQPD